MKFKIATVLCLFAISSCSSDSKKEFKYSGQEGRIVDNRKYELPEMHDKTSILHNDRLNKLGINVAWSLRLQNKREIRKFHVLKESVIVETEDNQIHSLDRHTGRYKWMVQINEKLDFDPFMHLAPDGRKMLFFIARNHLYCIDATKTYAGKEIGSLLWKRKLDHTAATSPHANDFDIIIGAEDNNFVMSYHYKDVGLVRNETKLIKPEFMTWHRALPDRITSAPTSTEDPNNPVSMVACHDGRIYGFLFSNGKTKWEFPTTGTTGGAFSANLLHHGDNVYAANTNHTLYILDGASGREDGKINLQAPLSKTPWVLGHLEYDIQGDGSTINVTRNDLDIFVQTDADFLNSDGYFYRIVVDNVVVRKIIDPTKLNTTPINEEEEEEEEEESDDEDNHDYKKRYFRRWETRVSWRLKGNYEFLFRTKNFIFLKQDNKLLKFHRMTGQKVFEHDLGETPISIYPDITSDYLKSRLYVATERDIYALDLLK